MQKRAVREPPPSKMRMKLDMWTARLITGPPTANPSPATKVKRQCHCRQSSQISMARLVRDDEPNIDLPSQVRSKYACTSRPTIHIRVWRKLVRVVLISIRQKPSKPSTLHLLIVVSGYEWTMDPMGTSVPHTRREGRIDATQGSKVVPDVDLGKTKSFYKMKGQGIVSILLRYRVHKHRC